MQYLPRMLLDAVQIREGIRWCSALLLSEFGT